MKLTLNLIHVKHTTQKETTKHTNHKKLKTPTHRAFLGHFSELMSYQFGPIISNFFFFEKILK